MKRILIVGAGAVGVVYGLHLQRGGAHVTFWVRPSYEAKVRAGVRVFRRDLWRRDHEEKLIPDDVVSSEGALKDRTFDAIWLCISATGADDGFLHALVRIAKGAVIVNMMPDTAGKVAQMFLRENVVDGLIPFLAWQSPLPTEKQKPVGDAAGKDQKVGISFWLPPRPLSTFSGTHAREIAQTLRTGGMKAAVVDDAGKTSHVGVYLLSVTMACLEHAGWKIDHLREKTSHEIHHAPQEAMHLVAAELGMSAWVTHTLAKPLLVSWIFRAARVFVPLPLEDYLRFHFTKVRPQTMQVLGELIAMADRQSAPAPALRKLFTDLSTTT